jgi:hypothetical protein
MEDVKEVQEEVVVHTPRVYSIDPKTRYTNEYSTCCSRTGKTDARLIRYASRFSMSVLTMGFAAVQIARAGDCDPLVPFYCSLFTFVLGAWVKADAAKQIQTP